MFFSHLLSSRITHIKNSVYGLSFHDLITKFQSIFAFFGFWFYISIKSMVKYLQCCDKYLIWLRMMNEWTKIHNYFFSLFASCSGNSGCGRAVRQFTCIAVKLMLNGCVCLFGWSVERLTHVYVCECVREEIDEWRRSMCQLWNLNRSSIDLMSRHTYK